MQASTVSSGIEVTPGMYRANPFRVLKLPVTADQREAEKQSRKLALEHKYMSSQSGADDRYEEDLKAALTRLKNPEARLCDELFWIWPAAPGQPDNGAMAAWNAGDCAGAAALWESQLARDPSASAAGHNLAVALHYDLLERLSQPASEFNIEERVEAWKRAYSAWRACLLDSKAWDFLTDRAKALNDPRVDEKTVRNMREELPEALLSLNCAQALRAVEGDRRDLAILHKKIIERSGLDKKAVQDALEAAISPLASAARVLAADAEKEVKADATVGYTVGKRLIESTRSTLAAIDLLLPAQNSTREAVHDVIAQQVLHNGIDYGNNTKDWEKALELVNNSLALAETESTKARISENIKILDGNVKEGVCFFCKKARKDDKASFKQKMYGNVKRTVNYPRTQITWSWREITIPRCQACRKIHNIYGLYTSLGMIAGLAIGIGITAALANSDASGYAWISMVVLAIAGYAGGAYACKDKRANVLLASKKFTYPVIKDLQKQGWKFGARPQS